MAGIYFILSKSAVPQTWKKKFSILYAYIKTQGKATLNEVTLLLCQDLAQGYGPISTGTQDNVKYTLIDRPPCRKGGHLDPSKMQAPSHVTCMTL